MSITLNSISGQIILFFSSCNPLSRGLWVRVPRGALRILHSTRDELSLIPKLIHTITAKSESFHFGIHETVEEFAESTFDMSSSYL